MDAVERSMLAERPIFIVGCARSGTTLLQLMLHAHPRIAIPPETRYLMEVYDRRAEFGDLREPDNVDRLVDAIVGPGTKFQDLGLDAETVRAHAHAAPPTLGSVLGTILALYAARWGKPRWGDKRPNYIQRLDVLLELFPTAQIVHIIRDGRDCVASLKGMTWWRRGTNEAIVKWIDAIRTAQWAQRTLSADRYHELRYEDLVTTPERELRALCAFLGEEYDARMLQHHEVAPKAVPAYKAWHVRTHGRVDDRSVRSWQAKLEREELVLMERMARPYLKAYGYKPTLASLWRRPTQVQLARYRAEKKERRRRKAKAQRLDVNYPWPVAAGSRSRAAAGAGPSMVEGGS